LSLALALAACGGTAQTVTAPAVGAQTAAAQPAGSGQLIFRKMDIKPDAAAPALIMNFIATGPNQGGVPCINCVYGASSADNVGLTGPSSYVLSNFTWQYEISFTDINYKGKCKVSFTIVSPSKKTIDSFAGSFSLPSAGEFALYAIARSRPSYSGAATVTGKYVCGKNSASTQEPIYFE
jgi:hypothetical protein